jgi:hypothetical protein
VPARAIGGTSEATPLNALADLLSRHSMFAKATAVVLAGLAWVLMIRPQVDPDFWWHLRVAEYVREVGDVPRTDFLSWMAMGEPWIAHSWLHDLTMLAAYSFGGLSGVGILGAVLAAAVVVLAYRMFMVALPASTPVICTIGTLAVAFIGGPVWSPRAQVWDVVFLLVAVIGWLTYRATGGRAWLVAMVPLGAAWSALHGSGIGAYVASALALAVVVAFGWLPGGRSRTVLAALVVATVLAMFVGPYGFGMLTYPFETIFSPVQARLIDEWAAPDLGDVRFIGFRVALVVLPVLLLLGRRFPDPLVGLLALGWGWLALGSARYLALAAPLIVAAALPSLDALRVRFLRHRPTAARSPSVAAAVLLLVPVLVLVAWSRISPSASDTAVSERYPEVATAALVEHRCAGRIWNLYDWGGYIGYQWREPVGAYGAADSLGDKRLEAYAAEAGGGEAFRNALERDGIQLAVVEPSGKVAKELQALADWKRLAGDHVGELWARSGRCE